VPGGRNLASYRHCVAQRFSVDTTGAPNESRGRHTTCAVAQQTSARSILGKVIGERPRAIRYAGGSPPGRSPDLRHGWDYPGVSEVFTHPTSPAAHFLRSSIGACRNGSASSSRHPRRPRAALRPRRRSLTSAGAHSPPTAPTAVGRIGLFALGPVPSARLLLRRLGPLAHALPQPP
jgi:hypothetical protein